MTRNITFLLLALWLFSNFSNAQTVDQNGDFYWEYQGFTVPNLSYAYNGVPGEELDESMRMCVGTNANTLIVDFQLQQAEFDVSTDLDWGTWPFS